MTTPELYELIGGNYEHALQIMRKDKMIGKYVLKLGGSDLNERLRAAAESMDAAQIFESAHAMKGVCGNLGLDALAEAAGEITEEFRPGSVRRLPDDEVRAKLAALDAFYERTLEGIRRYETELEEQA